MLVRPGRGWLPDWLPDWASGTVAAGHVRVHRDGGAVTCPVCLRTIAEGR